MEYWAEKPEYDSHIDEWLAHSTSETARARRDKIAAEVANYVDVWNLDEVNANSRAERDAAMAELDAARAELEAARAELVAQGEPASRPPAVAPERHEPASLPSEAARQRRARRYQMCLDAGLEMPSDDYRPLPRGINEIAKREGITRQALSEDIKGHIRSMKIVSR